MSNEKFPERIGRLEELAHNLWWSWHPQARALFQVLDYALWRSSGHNPVKQLRYIDQNKLQIAAHDPAFLDLYDSVMSTFDTYLLGANTWFSTRYADKAHELIAYFSAEYAIHNSLPIYAGGLGILAGDMCKEASDIGLPLVAIGFMYPQGYFHQHISADGWQKEINGVLDFKEAPINPALSPEGRKAIIQVNIDNRALYVGAWLVRVGQVSLYLLDTNIEENSLQDRQLSSRLYVADKEQRIQQEIVLGIGGVKVLRALGIKPSFWHANEGHTAFMTLERAREEVSQGASFDEAVKKVQATTAFTTHTPVPAGHDIFPVELVEKYFRNYWGPLNIDRKTLLSLGQHKGPGGDGFNMAVLALRMAGSSNGVSKLHGKTSQRIWNILWPGLKEEDVPISYITNGIHVPTWIAREMGQLYEKYLGQEWVVKQDDPGMWERVLNIPDEEIWAVRQLMRRKLLGAMLDRAQQSWADGETTAQQVLAMGSLLDPEVLTMGFVRRFVEYKRPALVFYDINRLKQIVRNKWQPVQIIFAGKSHPADSASKLLLQQVYSMAIDREFQGRIAFVEDYDMHMAHYLVQGVDLWLNTPRRLQEASGTSGMKASLNGGLNLSIKDGWWYEGYNGANGWTIGGALDSADQRDEDKTDAEALYNILENEIVPLYYNRDRNGVPHQWIRVAKEAIRSVAPGFCARRMMKEYTERVYLPGD